MTGYQQLVREFYETKSGALPHVIDAWYYLIEEMTELEDTDQGTADELKEMADVMFTLYGYALACGYDLDAAFLKVYQSNMTKAYTPEGKVSKGPGYEPPDLSDCMTPA